MRTCAKKGIENIEPVYSVNEGAQVSSYISIIVKLWSFIVLLFNCKLVICYKYYYLLGQKSGESLVMFKILATLN